MLKKTKKVLMLFICGTILLTQPVFAVGNQNNIDYYKQRLREQINDEEFDFLGRNGDMVYFKLRDDYAQNNPLKEIAFDTVTFYDQYKLATKTYKQSDLFYDLTILVGGIRYVIRTGKISDEGAMHLNKAMLKGLNGVFQTFKKL